MNPFSSSVTDLFYVGCTRVTPGALEGHSKGARRALEGHLGT